jgi:hypothetical protein
MRFDRDHTIGLRLVAIPDGQPSPAMMRSSPAKRGLDLSQVGKGALLVELPPDVVFNTTITSL